MTKNTFRKSDKLIIIPVLLLAACGGESEPVDLPFGTVQQMMADHVQPAADIYWKSVRFESRLLDDGSVLEQEFQPETDAEWLEIQNSAARLVEMGETLKSPAYADGRGEDWMIFAQGLVDASAKAEQAAIDHDPDAVFTEGGTVYNVCRACHQVFPPADLPEGEEGASVRPSGDIELDEYVEGAGTS